MTTSLHPKGFTLIEMAVVVVVIGIALSLGLKVATSLMRTTQLSETRAHIDLVKRATLDFLRTQRRLPCPDYTGDGAEAANCNGNAYGTVPWQTLGIPSDDALDGWGNFIRYHINGAWSNQNGFSIGALTTNPPATILSVQERLADGTISPVNNSIPFVLVSHGKNSYGSRTRAYTINAAAGAGSDEAENIDNDTLFTVRNPTADTGATGGAYDDIVEYMTVADLLGTLLNEGMFRNCFSYCSASPGSGCTTDSTIPIGAQGITCP